VTKNTGQQDRDDSESEGSMKSDESFNNFNENNDAEAYVEKFMKEHEER
jgi:hypothetical protein